MGDAPDGGWGWVVCLSSFMFQALTVGVTYTFGVLYLELLDFFQAGCSTTAWIGSIQPTLLYVTGIIGGPLLRRFGWRVVSILGASISAVGFCTSALVSSVYILYFTYGVLTGFGYGLMYMTSMVTVQHYFCERRSLATGLAVAGSGVGTLAFGFITPISLKHFGWRWTLVGDGAISLITGILFGCCYRPLPVPMQLNEPIPDEKTPLLEESHDITVASKLQKPSSCCGAICKELRDIFDFSLLRQPAFTIYTLTFFLFTFGYHVPYTYIPERAKQVLHTDTANAAFLVPIIGIANVGSRIIFGWIADRNMTVRHLMAAFVLILSGLATAGIKLWSNYILMALYSALFGLFSGCFAAIYAVIVVDLTGIDMIEKALGLLLGFASIGFLLASPTSGWIIDKTGSFDAPFYIMGSAQALGGLCFLTYVLWSLCCKKPQESSYSEIRSVLPQRKRRYLSASFS